MSSPPCEGSFFNLFGYMINQRFADRMAEIIALEGEVQKTLVPKVAAKQLETEKAKNRQELTEKEEEEAFLKGFNYDIIQEIQEGYSDKLKEELKSGRAWEESKEAFLQRANREGFGIVEGENTTFGFVRGRNRDFGWGSVEKDNRKYERAIKAKAELEELGIQTDIIDNGCVFWNKNGMTRIREVPEAATLNHRHIVINSEATLQPREMAGHEAFHLWENGIGRNEYILILQDNLLYSSSAFMTFQSNISQAYFDEAVDLFDERAMEKLQEEIFAYISGRIHAGIYDAQLRPMFQNYDAVKAAWYELIRRNR